MLFKRALIGRSLGTDEAGHQRQKALLQCWRTPVWARSEQRHSWVGSNRAGRVPIFHRRHSVGPSDPSGSGRRAQHCGHAHQWP